MTDMPVYDRTLALKLAGQQVDLAEDMLAGLIRTLPSTLHTLTEATKNKDLDTLKKTIHRLRGLICYCGVPRLQVAAADLETSLHDKQLKTFEEKWPVFVSEANVLINLKV